MIVHFTVNMHYDLFRYTNLKKKTFKNNYCSGKMQQRSEVASCKIPSLQFSQFYFGNLAQIRKNDYVLQLNTLKY